MKNTLEVVFGLSCYYSIKLSNLNKNIINFDAPLNFSDLSQINQNKLIIPKGIGEEEVYYLDNILNKINSAVDKGLKIRIWTSHEDVCCHLMLLYICNLLISRNANIYVIYTEDYDKDCYSPACLRHDEFSNLIKLEKKISDNDKQKLSKEWKDIIKINSDMRIIENGVIKSVSFKYYNERILNELSKLGCTRESKLVAELMRDIHLGDYLYVFIIENLKCNNKIKVITKSATARVFDDIISIVADNY